MGKWFAATVLGVAGSLVSPVRGAEASQVVTAAIGPVIVRHETLSAERPNLVEVNLGRIIVMRMPEEGFLLWKASGFDPEIVSFTPAWEERGGRFNSGFTPKKVGETEAVFTDGTTSYRLKIRVLPALKWD